MASLTSVPSAGRNALRALESYANRTGLIHDFGWIVLGTLTIVFIWLRPQGIFPERRPRYGGQAS